MEPNLGTIAFAFSFVIIVTGIIAWCVKTVVENGTKQAETVSNNGLTQYQDMTKKFVEAMTALNGGSIGGLVNSVGRMAATPIIEHDEVRPPNGSVAYQPRDNGQPQHRAPEGFSQHERPAAAGR